MSKRKTADEREQELLSQLHGAARDMIHAGRVSSGEKWSEVARPRAILALTCRLARLEDELAELRAWAPEDASQRAHGPGLRGGE